MGKPMTRKTPFWTGVTLVIAGAIGSTHYPDSPMLALLVLGIVMVGAVGVYTFIEWLSNS